MLIEPMTNSQGKPIARRTLFSAAGLLSYWSLISPGQASQYPDQPQEPGPAAFIDRAFLMRDLAREKGDQGYGAVVVREGIIIGQSWSRVILDGDPTAHAEIAAIRDAARRTRNRDLSNALLYSSSRPCPMCEAASYWAGIDRMIHGRDGIDAGGPRLC